MIEWDTIASAISEATGRPFAIKTARSVGGGCINDAFQIGSDSGEYFVKLNRVDKIEMFVAEAEGLQALFAANAIHIPQPLCWGTTQHQSFLVMEWVAFSGVKGGSEERFGEQLANLHRYSQSRFGWHRDNTIGATPQQNKESSDWVAFYAERRLQPQLDLAAKQGYGGVLQRNGAALIEVLPAFFATYKPAVSILHGDLWSGNANYDIQGNPVIFDPAVYFGDRETDLAMTELFGGFGKDFYAAYHAAWPVDAGYSTRKTLYNLYHILNHLNLFGASYQRQAEKMMSQLLANTHA